MFHKGQLPPMPEIAQEINDREPILAKICITANVQENVIFILQNFIFRHHVLKLEISQ
jgi:hypothetical protein